MQLRVMRSPSAMPAGPRALSPRLAKYWCRHLLHKNNHNTLTRVLLNRVMRSPGARVDCAHPSDNADDVCQPFV